MFARKLQFPGALFDGKSSTKHVVDVELTPQAIILKKVGHETVRWCYANLSWAAADTSPFHLEHCVSNNENECLEILVVEIK